MDAQMVCHKGKPFRIAIVEVSRDTYIPNAENFSTFRLSFLALLTTTFYGSGTAQLPPARI
jgi:hypothetical protein